MAGPRLAPIWVLLSWLMLTSFAFALDVPYLSGRVNDQAELLSDAGHARVSAALDGLEQTTGAQVVVLTLPSLEGESLEDYAIRIVETWALGRAGHDDGVLLLVARDDRKIRIEVGYGLEGVLTDLDSRRIIDFLMVPTFRSGDYEAGIESAVGAIAGAIRGEAGAVPEAGPTASGDSAVSPGAERSLFNAAFVVYVGVFAIILLPSAVLALSLKGSQGWTLYLFLAPFFLAVAQPLGGTAGFFSLLAWLTIFPVLRHLWPKKWQMESGTESGRNRGSRSSSRSRSGRSSSSRSSFSGGGGGFGGGGASGGW